jgi:hypothetical protein
MIVFWLASGHKCALDQKADVAVAYDYGREDTQAGEEAGDKVATERVGSGFEGTEEASASSGCWCVAFSCLALIDENWWRRRRYWRGEWSRG